MSEDVENLSYSDKWKKLNLFSLSKKRLRGHLIVVYKYLHGEKISDGRGLFNLADKDITRLMAGSRN